MEQKPIFHAKSQKLWLYVIFSISNWPPAIIGFAILAIVIKGNKTVIQKKREKILAWVKLSKATKYCSGALSFKAASLGAPHPELQLTFGVGIVNLCVVKNVLQNEENAFIWFWWKSGNTNSSCDTKLAKKFFYQIWILSQRLQHFQGKIKQLLVNKKTV